jgi:hypothetical protein
MLIQDQQPPTRFSRPAIQDQYRPQPLANFVRRSIDAPDQNAQDDLDEIQKNIKERSRKDNIQAALIYLQSKIGDIVDNPHTQQHLTKEEVKHLVKILRNRKLMEEANRVENDYSESKDKDLITAGYIRNIMSQVDPSGEFDSMEYPDTLREDKREDIMFLDPDDESDDESEYTESIYTASDDELPPTNTLNRNDDDESDDDVEDVPVRVPQRPMERIQQQPQIDNDIAPTPLQTPQHSQHPPIRPHDSFHSPQSEPQHHQIRQALSFETPQLEASPEPQRQSARISPVDFKKKKLTQALIASFIPSTAVRKSQKLTSSDVQAFARYAAILSKNTNMSHEEIMSKPFAKLRLEAGKYENV